MSPQLATQPLSSDIWVPDPIAPFLEVHRRFKIAFGGRGAGKSIGFANMLSLMASNGALIGCFREFQNAIDDSVYSLLCAQIRVNDMAGFQINKTQIDHNSGGGFRFRGLARSIEAVKSMHGFKYFWLEEGQFISADSIKILTPTLREANSELWISANPLNSADPFSQRFIVPYLADIERDGYYLDDLHLIVKIDYSDNDWFPEALEQERLYDMEHLPRAVYDHVWNGAFNDSVDDSIIPAEWFDASVDAHKRLGFEPRGAVVVAHDPSDEGGDAKGLCIRQGSVILDAQLRDFGEVNDGMDWALNKAIDANANLFVWDADGMGLGLKRQVADTLRGRKIDFAMFHGAETPDRPHGVYEPLRADDSTPKKQRTNRDQFKNKRAQFYWDLRDRFYAVYLAVEKGKYIDPDKMISISSKCRDIGGMRSEVCRIPRKYNRQGTIQIMTKPEMKTLKIKSPNLADSVMMSLTAPDTPAHTKPIRFDTFY